MEIDICGGAFRCYGIEGERAVEMNGSVERPFPVDIKGDSGKIVSLYGYRTVSKRKRPLRA